MKKLFASILLATSLALPVSADAGSDFKSFDQVVSQNCGVLGLHSSTPVCGCVHDRPATSSM